MSIPKIENLSNRDYRRKITIDFLENTIFTQSEIAAKCGVGANLVSVWKRGEKVPSKKNFQKLQNLFVGAHSTGGSEMDDNRERLIRLEGKLDALLALLGQQGVRRPSQKSEAG